MGSVNDRIDALKAERMLRGERKHGPLNLETDPRDFIQEAIEELIDFLNYLEMAMLQGKLPFCKWVLIDKDVRFTIWRLREENSQEARRTGLRAVKTWFQGTYSKVSLKVRVRTWGKGRSLLLAL
jgi:hypothetical protein